MIKLQLNKFKIVSLIRITDAVIRKLEHDREALTYSLKRGEMAAHNFVLKEFSRKLRSKFISIEEKPDMQNFFFSVNEMQAYVLVLYKDSAIGKTDYDYLTIQDLSVPMFKRLLN